MSRIACKEVRRGEGEGEVQVSDDDERREEGNCTAARTDSGVGPISSRGLEIFLLCSFYSVSSTRRTLHYS